MGLSLLVANGVLGSVLVWLGSGYLDCRKIAVISTLIGFVIFYMLTAQIDFSSSSLQLVESYRWIPALNVQFIMAIDGVSWVLIALTLFIHLIIVLSSFLVDYDDMPLYMALFLFMQSMIMGVFVAFDAVLFYMFWEGMLIPMYLCIGVFGSKDRSFAAMKFFLYTFLGSVFMLVGMIYLGSQAGSFAFEDMVRLPLSLFEQQWLFLALLFAFAVKIPMFPLHTWLPDAHTEAPASGSVILAALMLKVGAYGLIRISMPILPDASAFFAPLMVVLSLIAIIYVGIVAFSQTDIKRLIAYSSVAHMGFVTLGLFLIYSSTNNNLSCFGYTGALVQMISHAFGSGALFLTFGLLYSRCKTRQVSDLQGVASQMPYYSMFFMLFVFSTIGVPLTAGFVGEWMVLITALSLTPVVGLLATLTLVLSASYLLTMYKSVFFGVPSSKVSGLSDITGTEIVILSLISLVILAIGVYPQAIISPMSQSVNSLVELSQMTKLVS
ncbi:MAG: NADH-quinone oxidoreductase subunit M [Pseudomonadota bacterium]|nr:NADH-quinone oxidoreductase subunit M [Pseudomonadota bacterium]